MRVLNMIFVISVVFAIGCTRKTETNNITFKVPTFKKFESLGPLATAASLDFAVVNITYSNGRKVVRTVEMRDEDFNSTSTDPTAADVQDHLNRSLIFEGGDVVLGPGALVQFLGVYKDEVAGQEIFTYADVTANIVEGGNRIELDDQSFGTSSKNIEFAGRYYTSPTDGPTGSVIMSFQPPGGKPEMDIHKSHIFNGWFSFFTTDFNDPDVGLTYRMEDTGEVIFDKVNASSTMFTSISSEPYRVVVTAPALIRKRGNGDEESQVATDYIYGYWQRAGAGANFAPKSVCYPTHPANVRGMFTTAGAPISYNYLSGDVQIGAGGITGSIPDIFFSNLCFNPNGSTRTIFPSKMGQGVDELFGIRGPYSIVDAFSEYDSFLKFNYSTTPAVSVTVEWDYLFGVLGSSVTGSTVYVRTAQFNGGDDHYDDDEEEDCNQFATDSGYTRLGHSTTTSYAHTPSVANNYSNLEYMVCPYKLVGTTREYYHVALQGRTDSVERQQDWSSLGTVDFSGGTALNFGTDIGAYGKADGVSLNGSNVTIPVTMGSTSSFAVGNEVIIYIGSMGFDGNCGSFNGQNFRVGQGQRARIVDITGSNFSFPKKGIIGAMADQGVGSMMSVLPITGNNYCGVYLTKVEHYKNFTLDNSGSLFAEPFDYDTGGGMIAINAAGSLSLSGSIFADGSGYPEGPAAGDYGGGYRGPGGGNDTQSGGMGNPSVGWASGGSGASSTGLGADSSTAETGGQIGPGFGGPFMYGSAGGTDSGNLGGDGGGIVYLRSAQLSINQTVSVSADGGLATGGGGGGGGAGTLNIGTYSFITSGSSTLNLNASGGDAGNSVDSGVGGGGSIFFNFCGTGGTRVYDVTFGSIGSQTNAGNGQVEENDQIHYCN